MILVQFVQFILDIVQTVHYNKIDINILLYSKTYQNIYKGEMAMRNKKLVFAVSLLLVTIILTCVFVGCKPEEEIDPAKILMSFYKGDKKTVVHSLELTNLADYNIVNVYDDVLVARKYTDGENIYALFNIAENKIIATSDSNFSQATNGVYMTAKTFDAQTLYAFYGKEGILKDAVKRGEYSSQSGRIYFSDGDVIISGSNGVKVVEQIIDEVDIAYFDGNGDFNVVSTEEISVALSDDRDNFYVFDGNGKFMYSSRFSYLVESSQMDFNVIYLGNGKASIQLLRELTEVEARRLDSYDFIDESGVHIALTTYVYDFMSKELVEVDFNKAIEGVIDISKDEKYSLLATCDITENNRLSNGKLTVVDNSLNVVLELNDFVDDARGFAVIDESAYAIADSMTVNVFNAKGEKVKSYVDSAEYTRTGLLKLGKKFYNLKGEKVFELEDNMIWSDDRSTDGLIYFSREIDGVGEVGVFDSKTGNLTYYDGDCVNMYSAEVFSVADGDGKITVYGMYDGKPISNKKFESENHTKYGKYTFGMAPDGDGNTSYFAHWIERPNA